MLKSLTVGQIKALSFSDAPVTEFVLDTEKHEIQFKSDAFVGCVPTGRWVDGCNISIREFSTFSITEEDNQVVSKYTREYALREICEFEYSEETIVMRGFTVGRGLWTEYRISNGQISVTYDESNQHSVHQTE